MPLLSRPPVICDGLNTSVNFGEPRPKEKASAYGFNYGVLGYVTGQMVARWFEGRSVPLLMNLNAVPLTSGTLAAWLSL